ncbi:hypothetical protein LguiA_001899 [Lonicera macranthoides]
MGPIIVDVVVYEKVDDDLVSLFPSKELVFHCLTFQRSEPNRSFAHPEGCQNVASGKEQKTRSPSKSSKKKGNQRRNDSLVSVTNDSRNELKVDHDYLSSSYHTGIISGFMLISSYLESVASTGRTNAGLLQSFTCSSKWWTRLPDCLKHPCLQPPECCQSKHKVKGTSAGTQGWGRGKDVSS